MAYSGNPKLIGKNLNNNYLWNPVLFFAQCTSIICSILICHVHFSFIATVSMQKLQLLNDIEHPYRYQRGF